MAPVSAEEHMMLVQVGEHIALGLVEERLGKEQKQHLE